MKNTYKNLKLLIGIRAHSHANRFHSADDGKHFQWNAHCWSYASQNHKMFFFSSCIVVADFWIDVLVVSVRCMCVCVCVSPSLAGSLSRVLWIFLWLLLLLSCVVHKITYKLLLLLSDDFSSLLLFLLLLYVISFRCLSCFHFSPIVLANFWTLIRFEFLYYFFQWEIWFRSFKFLPRFGFTGYRYFSLFLFAVSIYTHEISKPQTTFPILLLVFISSPFYYKHTKFTNTKSNNIWFF